MMFHQLVWNLSLQIENEGLVTTAVMRVSDLKVSFNDMLARGKRHEPKEKYQLSIVPLVVEGEDYFVVDRVSDAYKVNVCNICIPPVAISGPGICGATYDEVKVNRVIRNHMASHQLKLDFDHDACAFCCKQTCKLALTLEGRDKNSVTNFKPQTNPRLKAPTVVGLIRPSTLVSPNCLTYPSIRPFMYKFCSKGTKEYPAVNMPYFCQRCRTWIWSYNIPSHYDNRHDEFWD